MGPMWPMAPNLLTFAGLSPGALCLANILPPLWPLLCAAIGHSRLRPLHFLIPLLGPSPDTVAPVFSLVSA